MAYKNRIPVMAVINILVIVIFTFGGILMVIVGFPGTFVTLGGIFLVALLNGFKELSLGLLGIFFAVAIIGELLEYISGIMGAHRYGASTKGTMGAIVGGMAGVIIGSTFFIGLGTVIGVFAGTFLGAFIGEYISGKDLLVSSKVGWGAFLGRVVAISVKVLIILVISSVAIFRYI